MKRILVGVLVSMFMFGITVAGDKPAAKGKQTKATQSEMKKEKKDDCSHEKSCCEGMKESKAKSSDNQTEKKADEESAEKK